MANKQYRGLRVRKLADQKPGETRIRRYNPETGEPHLVNPATGREEPWPLLGVTCEGECVNNLFVPTTTVNRGISEGWIETDGEHVVHKPGGPPTNPWAVTHTFIQVERIRFKFVEGDVAYKVVHQPDKYEDTSEDSGYRVDWFYLAEKEADDG